MGFYFSVVNNTVNRQLGRPCQKLNSGSREIGLISVDTQHPQNLMNRHMDSEIPQGLCVNQSGKNLMKPCRGNIMGSRSVGLWEEFQPGLLDYP